MKKITPFLWFDNNAEEAAEYYISVFPNSRRVTEVRNSGPAPGPAGSIVVITLEIDGQQVTFLNGGPAHKLSEAFSFSVSCETQEEIDGYWSKLTDGGKEIACGWLKDKFGLCWQIVPANIGELVSTPGGMQAMMKMVKLDIAVLKAASEA